MKHKSQRLWVIEQLEKDGEISRNQCLSNFISRLGAIACDLKAEGYDLTPERRGNDYFYVLNAKPKPVIDPRLEASRRMEEQLAVYD